MAQRQLVQESAPAFLSASQSWVKVAKIEPDGVEPVYNLEVPGLHNFAVNGGYIVHNCIDAARYALISTLGRPPVRFNPKNLI